MLTCLPSCEKVTAVPLITWPSCRTMTWWLPRMNPVRPPPPVSSCESSFGSGWPGANSIHATLLAGKLRMPLAVETPTVLFRYTSEPLYVCPFVSTTVTWGCCARTTATATAATKAAASENVRNDMTPSWLSKNRRSGAAATVLVLLRVTKLGERAGLQLPDAFARQREAAPDLLERVRPVLADP